MKTLENVSEMTALKPNGSANSNVQIAVVEDDAMYRQAIEVYLKKIPGIEVHSYDSGEQYFKHYTEVKPDVLVLDYRLNDAAGGGGMDGLDVMRKAKTMKPASKIIFLTGQGDMDTAVAAIKGGAIDFIPKNKNGLTRLVELVQRVALGIQIQRQESNTTRWITIGVITIALIVIGTLFADSEGIHSAWSWLWFALSVGVVVLLVRSWVKRSRSETKKIQTLDSKRMRKWID